MDIWRISMEAKVRYVCARARVLSRCGPGDKYVKHVIRAAFSDMPQRISKTHLCWGKRHPAQYTPAMQVVVTLLDEITATTNQQLTCNNFLR